MQRSELRRDGEDSWVGVKAKVREFFVFEGVHEVNRWGEHENKRSICSPWDGAGAWNDVGWPQRGLDHTMV
jgi:hypothetical protein